MPAKGHPISPDPRKVRGVFAKRLAHLMRVMRWTRQQTADKFGYAHKDSIADILNGARPKRTLEFVRRLRAQEEICSDELKHFAEYGWVIPGQCGEVDREAVGVLAHPYTPSGYGRQVPAKPNGAPGSVSGPPAPSGLDSREDPDLPAGRPNLDQRD